MREILETKHEDYVLPMTDNCLDKYNGKEYTCDICHSHVSYLDGDRVTELFQTILGKPKISECMEAWCHGMTLAEWRATVPEIHGGMPYDMQYELRKNYPLKALCPECWLKARASFDAQFPCYIVEHKCCLCEDDIAEGERYSMLPTGDDGAVEPWCNPCYQKAMNSLFDHVKSNPDKYKDRWDKLDPNDTDDETRGIKN